jgi:hypothetical protein
MAQAASDPKVLGRECVSPCHPNSNSQARLLVYVSVKAVTSM